MGKTRVPCGRLSTLDTRLSAHAWMSRCRTTCVWCEHSHVVIYRVVTCLHMYKAAVMKHGRSLVESSKNPRIFTRILTRVAWIAREIKKQNESLLTFSFLRVLLLLSLLC
jgi:hypothetical protein